MDLSKHRGTPLYRFTTTTKFMSMREIQPQNNNGTRFYCISPNVILGIQNMLFSP